MKTDAHVGSMFTVTPDQPKAPREQMADYRDRMRAAGLRPIQIWVPDVRANGFETRLRRQITRLSRENEAEAMDFIETTERDL